MNSSLKTFIFFALILAISTMNLKKNHLQKKNKQSWIDYINGYLMNLSDQSTGRQASNVSEFAA